MRRAASPVVAAARRGANRPKGKFASFFTGMGELASKAVGGQGGTGNSFLTRPFAVSQRGAGSSTAERLVGVQRVAGSTPVLHPTRR